MTTAKVVLYARVSYDERARGSDSAGGNSGAFESGRPERAGRPSGSTWTRTGAANSWPAPP
jgi:hypothetical protein